MFRFLLAVSLASVAMGASPQIRPRVPMLDGRIVGGVDVEIEEYPYQVSLLWDQDHRCGGSIIAPNKILTAAHCTTGIPSYWLAIRHSSSKLESGGVVVNVLSVAQHPQFDPITIDYDISVLTLESNITESATSKIVQLVADGTPEGGRKAVCTGWGSTSSGGSVSYQLKAVEVEEVDRKQCNDVYGSSITDRMNCFGSSGKDSCQGDSGGPLVVAGEQVGIVSWGRGCAVEGVPGVYADVANLKSYIIAN